MPSHLSSSGSGGGGSYTLPTASGSVLGGVKVGSGLAIDGSGVLGPAAVPSVRASSSVALTLASASNVRASLDTTDWDQGTASAQHSTSSTQSHLVCRQAGIYLISAGATISQNASGLRDVGIQLNGTTWVAEMYTGANPTDVTIFSLSALYQLALGDYVELVLYQDSGSTLQALANRDVKAHIAWCRLG